MKKYLYLFLIAIFMFPFYVKAYTEEEANELFDSLGDEITIQGVNPSVLNYMNDENEWFYRVAVLKLHLLKNPNEALRKIINYEDDLSFEIIDDGNALKVTVWCTGSNSEVSKNIPLKYVDLDETEYSKAKQITDELEYYYQLGGVSAINSLYNYGKILDENTTTYMARLPELKKVIEQHPEYDFEIIQDRGGSVPNWQEDFSYVGIYKNNILYSYKEILLHVDEIIFVDKDKNGTLTQRAKERLTELFTDSVNITVEDVSDEYKYGPDVLEVINEDYKDINIYNIIPANVTIGDKELVLMIAETDASGVDKYYVESSDKESGVAIQTNSYDVPIDSRVKVTDVSDEDYVKKAASDNNMKIVKVYDIDLVKYSDKKSIKEIKAGLEINIPIENAKEGEEVIVYYINSDGELAEKINGKVVKLDEKLYVKFVTYHLSTFAILEPVEVNVGDEEIITDPVDNNVVNEEATSDPVDNNMLNEDTEKKDESDNPTKEINNSDVSEPVPQTDDNIIRYISIYIISLLTFVGSWLYFKRMLKN